MIHLVLGLAIGVLSHSTAIGQEAKVAKDAPAWVTTEGAVLTLSNKVVAKLAKNTQFEVVLVKGSFAAGTAQHEGKKVQGWLRLSDLTATQPKGVTRVSKKADDPKAVAALKKLKVKLTLDGADRVIGASLDQSDATDDDLIHLKGLPNLATLMLSGSISDDGLKHIEGLTGLRVLSLGYGSFTDKGLARLEKLTAVEDLNLYATQITDKGLAHLSDMKRLRKLDLGGTQIKGTGLKHLKDLSALRELLLFECPVEDDAIDHISRLSGLEILDLVRTNVKLKSRAIGRIKQMKKLKRLSVREIAEQDQAALKRATDSIKAALPELTLQ